MFYTPSWADESLLMQSPVSLPIYFFFALLNCPGFRMEFSLFGLFVSVLLGTAIDFAINITGLSIECDSLCRTLLVLQH